MNQDIQMKVEEIASRGYEFNFGQYISNGFKIFGKNAGGFIGFFILLIVYSLTVQFITGQIGMLGLFLGMALAVTVTPAIQAGWYISCYEVWRNGNTSFSAFFDGLKIVGQVALFTIVSGLILGVLSLLVLIPIASAISDLPWAEIMLLAEQDVPDEALLVHVVQQVMLVFLDWGFVDYLLMLLLAIPSIYLSIAWSLSLIFIVVGKANFWTAMELSRKIVTKKWFHFFLLYLVLGLILIGGLLALLVGILVAVPVMYASMYSAFDDIVGDAVLHTEGMGIEDHLIAEE